MDETSCGSCGVRVTGEDWRLLPTAADDTLIDGTFCESCWQAALAATRAYVAAGDPEEFDDVVRAGLVRAYLQACDIDVGSPDQYDRASLHANALHLLDQIGARGGFWWRRVMCSGCYATPRELAITTIPWWNADRGDYVTTYRCKACLAAGLADTRQRLRRADDEVARICAFFERHAVFVHEYRRGEGAAAVRPIVEVLLGHLEDGSMVLPIGKTQSLKP